MDISKLHKDGQAILRHIQFFSIGNPSSEECAEWLLSQYGGTLEEAIISFCLNNSKFEPNIYITKH